MKYLLINVFVLLFLFNCNTSLNAQSIEPCDYNKIYRVALKNKSPDTINQVLKNDSLILTKKDKAELYSYRALLTSKLNKLERKKNRTLKDSILNDANTATSFLKGEENLRFILRRNRIRTRYLRLNSAEKDKIILKNYGYKPEKSGIGLRLLLRKDANFWGGVEVSLNSIITPEYNLKTDSVKIKSKKYTRAISLFILGYAKSFTDIQQEYKLSLLRLESPLYVDLLQFGILDNLSEERFFYRPEIGVGKWGFTLTYGYNAFLNKGNKYNPSKHLVNLRYLHTFNKKRK